MSDYPATLGDLSVNTVKWTALGVSCHAADRPPRIYIASCAPQQPFRGVYLIVTSPGWFIHEARAANKPFLSDVAGDAYSRDEHDRLERLGQLERHRISFSLQVGNLLSFTVSPKCIPSVCGEREAVLSGLADSGCPHPRLPFSAVVIGVEQ
jgi:hypothetical protein